MSIEIRGISETVKMLAAVPKQVQRATEQALDFTARHIQSDVQKEMLQVFDKPVDYTIKGVKTTLTKGHNMQASVWIATPQRMAQSYMVPQVEGGQRNLKGFELAAGKKQYDLAVGAKRTAAGNITVAQAKALVAGTKRRGGDFVIIGKGNKSGLLPGVYQRVKAGRGFSRKTAKGAQHALQQGRRKGRYASAVMARGLKPILIAKENQGEQVKPQLDFYGVAHRTFAAQFERRFGIELAKLIGGR